jgi:hypothetical protein
MYDIEARKEPCRQRTAHKHQASDTRIRFGFEACGEMRCIGCHSFVAWAVS